VNPLVEPAEYAERQHRARTAAAARGLQALVAFSRGGHERSADGLWLVGLATSQPFVPDLAGHWRATGHVVVVLPVDGPVTAIVESDELEAAAMADEVVVADDVVLATARVLRDAVPDRSRVGVLGADVVPFAWWMALGDGIQLEPVDELGAELRRVKSPAEQRLLRAAGRLGAEAMGTALEAAAPGVTEADVAATFVEHVVRGGGAIYDVVISSGPGSIALGPHDRPAGWTTRELAAGELLRIDAYGSVGGYLFDFARTVVVGGQPSVEQAELIDSLRAAVQAGIAVLRPGVPLGDVARACEEALAASEHAQRHGTPKHVMGGFWGHGLGLGFDPPWIGPASQEVVEQGWCLAVERRAAVPGLGGAQWEDDVLVGSDGPEVLTGASG
jgi:ectoine hydrolase